MNEVGDLEGDTMAEYINLVFRAVFLYFLIILYLRIMGKREVGELSVFDLVLYFVMSELLALSMENIEESMWKSIVPITTLTLLQMALSWILLKKKKARDFIEGNPVIIIKNGRIDQKEMIRQRYSIDDLMFQLRDKNIGSISEVDFAILENSGVLTVLKKGQNVTNYPHPLISDGEIKDALLKDAGVDRKWLIDHLKNKGYEKIEDIFLCMWEKGGLYVVLKDGKINPDGMQNRSRYGGGKYRENKS